MQAKDVNVAYDAQGDEHTGAHTESKKNGSNLETLVIAGRCSGSFIGRIDRKFSGNHVVLIKQDGTVLVHDTKRGVVPVCYLSAAENIELDRDMADTEIEVFAAADDEKVKISFTNVRSMFGMPSRQSSAHLARAILQCVSEVEGKLGRVNVARILTGSCNRQVLTMDTRRLKSFGKLSSRGMKEVLHAMNELVRVGYLEVSEDPEYPTLSLSATGLVALREGGLDNLKLGRLFLPEKGSKLDDESSAMADRLKVWRDSRAKSDGVPPYIVLSTRTLTDLAVKRPKDREELERIYGIGPAKSARYAVDILDIINNG